MLDIEIVRKLGAIDVELAVLVAGNKKLAEGDIAVIGKVRDSVRDIADEIISRSTNVKYPSETNGN